MDQASGTYHPSLIKAETSTSEACFDPTFVEMNKSINKALREST